MTHKYGAIEDSQMKEIKKDIRRRIFFLLLYVDPDTKDGFANVSVTDAFESLMIELGGMNSLFNYPVELTRTLSLLEAARNEYLSPEFSTNNFRNSVYRKLILDAGSEINKIKEG